METADQVSLVSRSDGPVNQQALNTATLKLMNVGYTFFQPIGNLSSSFSTVYDSGIS